MYFVSETAQGRAEKWTCVSPYAKVAELEQEVIALKKVGPRAWQTLPATSSTHVMDPRFLSYGKPRGVTNGIL